MKKWREKRLALALCAVLGWWGVFYPEFTLMPDTCKVMVCEEGEDGEISLVVMDPQDSATLYREILSADADQVVLKSRLLTELEKIFEQKK